MEAEIELEFEIGVREWEFTDLHTGKRKVQRLSDEGLYEINGNEHSENKNQRKNSPSMQDLCISTHVHVYGGSEYPRGGKPRRG